MGGVVKSVREHYYKPHHIFVLDPLEYVAMGLNVIKARNGEERWKRMHKDKWKHPDAQKIACVAYGALIYTALFPDRTHADMRPPEDWKHEAGITESSLWDAKKQLIDEDPEWEIKQRARIDVNAEMDGFYGEH